MNTNTPHSEHTLSLDQLNVGESGFVSNIEQPSSSDQKLVHRLMDIGFIPGEPLQILHKGFWGGPIAVKIGQSTFALRRFEAALISVIPDLKQASLV